MNYLTVDIYDQFQCIADRCPNTCCTNWTILMDDATCQKMIEHENELEIRAKDWLVKENGVISVKNKNNRCSMLTENNLCKVVLRLGPQYLCDTCRTYPRMSRQYGSFMEEYLLMSCPEVIHMLMQKETVDILLANDHLAEGDPCFTDLYLFEANVRTHIFQILKYKQSISLSARLFLAFTVLNEAVQMYQNGCPDSDVFEKNCSSIQTLPYIEKQLSFILNDVQRFDIIKQALHIFYNDFTPHKRFNELIQNAIQYFNERGIDQYREDIQKFKETCCVSFQNFYTNYWICHIFSDLISIPDYQRSKEIFIYDAVEFAFIQTISLVSYVNKGVLDKSEYSYVISCFARAFEHNHSFRSQLMEEIQKNNLISAAGLLMFIIS